ncbi:MAG: insulinase family protein [Proteobacteria bacterium]|nr:insulinase family protein [Pseudomonadota bacterium]
MLQPKLYSLSNGIPVIIDHMPGIESITIAAYMKNGSRDESTPADFGISHLLEHMAFKGTKTRDKHAITTAIENIGGVINAYTAWNVTAFISSVPVPHKTLAAATIADIVQNMTIPDDELAKEKAVVIQEIKAYQDIPEAVLESAALSAVFRGGMQHDIAGTCDGVAAMTRTQILKYFNAHYSAKNCTLVLSGGGLGDTDAVLAELEELFGGWAARAIPKYEYSTYAPALSHTHRGEMSHSYFRAVWPTRPAATRDGNNDIEFLMAILGAGFSSRLFQELRERLGLVYGVGAGALSFEDIGIVSVDAQTTPEKMTDTVAAIAKICGDLRAGRSPITAGELARVKEMVKGALIMGLENTSRRADFFASRSTMFGGVDDMKKNMAAIDAVTLASLNAAALKIFATPPSIITLGLEDSLPLSEWQGWF